MLYPIGIIAGLHYFVLYDGIILFLCFVLTKIIALKRPQIAQNTNPLMTFHYFIAAFCLLMSNYFYSGVKKVLESPKGINWVFENEQDIDFQWFIEQGWLYFLSPDFKNQLVSIVHVSNSFMLSIVLLAQLGVIFSFKNKSYFRFVVGALIGFHIGFFLLDGCSFLEWIVLDLAFIYIFSINRAFEKRTFTKNTLIVSIALFLLGFIIFTPQKLSWYESHIRRLFSFKVENTEGALYDISPNDLGLSNAVFAGLSINYLFDKKTLCYTAYSTKYEGMKTIKNATTLDLDSLTTIKGENPYNAFLKDNTEKYIKNFFKNSDKQYDWLSFISPPGHYLAMRWQKSPILPKNIDKPKFFILTAKEFYMNKNYSLQQRDSLTIVFDLK